MREMYENADTVSMWLGEDTVEQDAVECFELLPELLSAELAVGFLGTEMSWMSPRRRERLKRWRRPRRQNQIVLCTPNWKRSSEDLGSSAPGSSKKSSLATTPRRTATQDFLKILHLWHRTSRLSEPPRDTFKLCNPPPGPSRLPNRRVGNGPPAPGCFFSSTSLRLMQRAKFLIFRLNRTVCGAFRECALTMRDGFCG